MASQQQPGTIPPDQLIVATSEAIRGGNNEGAAALADRALAFGLRHPVLYNARALALQQKGQFREALAEFNHARALAPRDARISNAIGVCLLNLNQPMEALKAFEQAIASDPSYAQPYFRKGWILEMLGDRDEARKFYETTVKIDPNHAEALGSLASAEATAGRNEEAQSFAERALKIDPSQPTAVVALGIVDLANRNYAAAESRLRSVIDSAQLTLRTQAIVTGLVADALDGQGRYAEAFACYRYENNEKRKLYAQSYTGETRPPVVVGRIAAFVNASPAESWMAKASSDRSESRVRTHAFLVGFSRSGTTLLEQVLASHSDIVALEEQDLLAAAAQDLLASDAGMRKLVALTEDECEAMRSDYWRRIRDRGLDVADKVFVDKLPLNTIKLPLIARLFPKAKIIFALRDPRDVILSCYRRHFAINTAMFEFLTLDDAVEFYDAVMTLGVACREKLPLETHLHRYEDMVADFDNSIAAVCDFVGVEPSPAMREFQHTRGLGVRSPSAAQIRRPLNEDSVGVWRHYRENLAPVLPFLRPWAERFGYAAD